MQDSPYISLIIPMYNASEYVEKCFEMIEKQTLDNIEAVFVDDCGSDGTLASISSAVSSYSGGKRFVVVQTESNSGPGAARNLGLSKASGEYVCFVDCDDEIFPDYCEKLYREAVKYKADMVSCNAMSGDDILCSPAAGGTLSKAARKKILRSFVTYLWTYAFRREFISAENISFPPQRSSEDSCFVACAWLKASRVAHVESVLYKYIRREGSVSSRRDRSRSSSRMASLRAFYKYASDRGLLSDYRFEIWLIMLKKGYLPSLFDRLENI